MSATFVQRNLAPIRFSFLCQLCILWCVKFLLYFAHCLLIHSESFIFSRRIKLPLLGTSQYLLIVLKDVARATGRVRVDEDVPLAKTCEISTLLERKNSQLETKGGCGSKLNCITDIPSRKCRAKVRVWLGAHSTLLTNQCYFAR